MSQGIPKGYCQCGCGENTNIAPKTHKSSGRVKGEPIRFIDRHSSRGENHPMWRGGKSISGEGYVYIYMPDHPQSGKRNCVFEHILVCEKVLGKYLPPGVVIHHVNEDRTDNRPENLVICQDKAYHNLLHRRMKALRACGHADWLKCGYCKQYDDPKNLRLIPKSSSQHHTKCLREYMRERRENLKKERRIKS